MSKREIIQLVLVEQRDALLGTARHFANTHAEDLYQDTAIHVLEHAEKLRDTRNVLAWVRTAMYYLFVNQYRRQQRQRKHVDALTEPWALPALPAEDVSVTEKLMRALPEHYRIVLDVVMLQGMSYKEAAAHLNLPLGTIMSRKSRALSMLRRYLLEHPAVERELLCAAA